ncbi:peptidoglycan DD-metalloendopeptidase family protein [Epibacterium sp. SM1979]|uniref:Peptidoglycan DD-metalloendopeptidase family protein n=1 Tax=Tritonibacter litoralis TaxID=2662264 RepID=A0A843YI44_9RHOB|nr:M23 family metallopeptidase [Tritonibacter litoralis]MQQ09478.1 peptidoglycan DD-metalloendopeptidase family protein [Tritonibacter litoralis]
MKQAWAIAFATTLAPPLGASDFLLHWPVDCTLGDSCHIQQYVDHDPGPEAQDFRCQGLTYDGHKGTDIALPTLLEMHAGVAVLAAAPGVVAGVRNSMVDQRYTDAHADQIQGRECGNGVVLKHNDGWETQYCHLKQGSVLVEPGQTVAAGTPLGEIGLSGQTQFPHLHLSVRKNGAVVDPFTPEALGTSCSQSADTLWSDPVPYTPGGLLATGFSATLPDYDAIRAGTAAADTLSPAAPALVFWGYAFGGRLGDQLELQITGPQGAFISHTEELPKAQSQFFRAAGRRLRETNWPKGEYTGTARLVRAGQVIDQAVTSILVN